MGYNRFLLVLHHWIQIQLFIHCVCASVNMMVTPPSESVDINTLAWYPIMLFRHKIKFFLCMETSHACCNILVCVYGSFKKNHTVTKIVFFFLCSVQFASCIYQKLRRPSTWTVAG